VCAYACMYVHRVCVFFEPLHKRKIGRSASKLTFDRYVCVCVCMHVCIRTVAHMVYHTQIYIYIYIYILYIYIYIYIYIYKFACSNSKPSCIHASACMCVYTGIALHAHAYI
jgi:hypothetical protein